MPHNNYLARNRARRDLDVISSCHKSSRSTGSGQVINFGTLMLRLGRKGIRLTPQEANCSPLLHLQKYLHTNALKRKT